MSVAVRAGDVVGLRGPSGSGKSTLLRCLALLETRADGDVLFHGSRVADRDVPGYRRQVGFVAQAPPRFPMTVMSSLAHAFSFRAVSLEWNEARARQLCEQLLLPASVLTQPLGELSGGENQRVALVRALLLEPVALLLDEPTAALDPEARSAAASVISAWLGAGDRAAIVVSHDADGVGALATRHAVLRDGTLVEEAA